METCNVCGEPIVFRYMEGVPTPIHTNGGWCRGSRETKSIETSPFRSVSSYLVPNATCPVCGESVFFYQSASGGRVFFDDVGWPWPKHPCTDNRRPVGKPSASKQRGPAFYFRTDQGAQLALYDLDDVMENDTYYRFIFRRQDANKRRSGLVSKNALRKGGVRLNDFFDAPSFVVNLDKSREESLRVDFICARLQKIVKIKMKKNRKAN